MTESLVSVVYFVCHSLKTTTTKMTMIMIMMIMIIIMTTKHWCNDKQQKKHTSPLIYPQRTNMDALDLNVFLYGE